jgi:hypothetical protein
MASTEGVTPCMACPLGSTTLRAGSTAPTDCRMCPLGRYGNEQGMCMPCPLNTFRNTTGGVNATACTPCQGGSSSSGFSGVEAATCCAPGYYAPPGTLTCFPCPSGSFCPAGAQDPSPCPAGTFFAQPQGAAPSDCMPCAPGSFSAETGSRTCTLCPSGTYSSEAGASAASACRECPPGRFQATPGASQCSACNAGSFNTLAGSTAASACLGCAAGSYSTPASPSCILCPAGTFNPSEKSTNASFCQQCPPGSSNANQGAVSIGSCIACPPGYFIQVGGASACQPCTAGSYCPPLGDITPCPAGTYSSLPGQTDAGACQSCTPGRASPTLGATQPSACALCPPGYYAEAPGAAACAACPQGSYLDGSGGTSPLNCTPCDPGTYNSAVGQSSLGCVACRAGYFLGARGATARAMCLPCAAGFFAGTTGAPQCDPCPGGAWSAPAAARCTACDFGAFLPLGSLDRGSAAACVACPPGRTTASQGSILASQCITLPVSCGLGQQPAPGTAAGCQALTCPPPLLPSAAFDSEGALKQQHATAEDAAVDHYFSALLNTSLNCVGCDAGWVGAQLACLPCPAAAGGGDGGGGVHFCPGLGSVPLVNFSSPEALRLVRPTCPSLADVLVGSDASAASASHADSISVSVLAVGGGLGALVVVAALALSRWGRGSTAVGRACAHVGGCLRAFDAYAIKPPQEEGGSPTKKTSHAGGALTILAIGTILLYGAYLVVLWLGPSNMLVQSSLGIMKPQVLQASQGLPWARASAGVHKAAAASASTGPGSSSSSTMGATAGGSSSSSSSVSAASGLVVRLRLSGEPGMCVSPMQWASEGLAGGSWEHMAPPPAATVVQGGGGAQVAPITFLCPSCTLTQDARLSITLHYSCQSMHLEAAGIGPWPLSSVSLLEAPLSQTRAAAAPPPSPASASTSTTTSGSGELLASIQWVIPPVYSVLYDDMGGSSAQGYLLSTGTVTPVWAAPGTLGGGAASTAAAAAASGSAAARRRTITPATSHIALNISFPLESVYMETRLSQRVPWTQLLANIVGLAGVLGLFGGFLGVWEMAQAKCASCGRGWGRGRGGGGSGTSGGGSGGGVLFSGGESVLETPPSGGGWRPHQSPHHRHPPLLGSLCHVALQQEEVMATVVNPLHAFPVPATAADAMRQPPTLGADPSSAAAPALVPTPAVARERDTATPEAMQPQEAVVLGESVGDAGRQAEEGTGGAAESSQAPDPANIWRRHSDDTGDVWFSNTLSGQVVWDLPEGAVLKKSFRA